MHPQHVIVKEGDAFNLRCSFNQNVRCMWKQIATPWLVMRTELLHQFRHCTLTFEKASLRDEGLWSCIGTNITNPTNHLESDIVMVIVIPKPIGQYIRPFFLISESSLRSMIKKP